MFYWGGAIRVESSPQPCQYKGATQSPLIGVQELVAKMLIYGDIRWWGE